MNLFEIDREITSCIKLENSDNFVNTETGEIIDLEALQNLEMERDRKIRNIACWIRNLESDEKQLAEQEKIFRDRKNVVKAKRESLKSYLSVFLGGKKWENSEVKVSWRKSESVEITDAKKLSKYYLNFKDPEPNKTLIKADLKNGISLDGAVLVTKNNMQVK